MNSQQQIVYYHDPTLPFDKEHFFPAFLAILVLALFNLLPLLLLCLYPCRCFHRCLNKTGCRWQALHVFMDAILGAYSHKPRERRFFGSIYICIRVLHLLAYALNIFTYYQSTSYIMVIALVLVSLFQPYRNRWHNVVDIVLFSALLHGYLTLIYLQNALHIDSHMNNVYRHFYHLSVGFILPIIPVYGTIAVLAMILPKKFFQKFLLAKLNQWRNKHVQPVDSDAIPYRMEHSETEPLVSRI